MPLYHTMGVRSLLAMALKDGTFVCLPRFEAGEALRLIARERISNLYLVPTLYHDLIGHPDFAATDTGTVTKLGFAGAAMPEGLLKRVDLAFRPELFPLLSSAAARSRPTRSTLGAGVRASQITAPAQFRVCRRNPEIAGRQDLAPPARRRRVPEGIA
jgi:acyl-CoA synthetase (AMP-forming)/AMP-acid ligase II